MNRFKRPALALLFSVFVGAAISAGMLVLFSLLCVKIGVAGGGAAAAFSVAAACIGALAAGFTAAKLNGSRGIFIGAAGGILMFTMLLVLMIAAGGAVTYATLLRLGLMLLSGAVGGVLGVR